MSARNDETAGGIAVVVVDVSGYQRPDLQLIDMIARVRLAAARLGASFAVRGAGPDVVRLLELVGLPEVIPLDASPPLQALREPEPGEQAGVEEVVDVRDPPASDLQDLDGPRLVPPPGTARPVLGEGR